MDRLGDILKLIRVILAFIDWMKQRNSEEWDQELIALGQAFVEWKSAQTEEERDHALESLRRGLWGQ